MTACAVRPTPALASTRVSWRKRLRTAVLASRRKHSAIAADAGIAPETLSRILNAAGAKPAFETVVKIAHAVNESVGWLLNERGFALSSEQEKTLAETVDFLQATLVHGSAARRSALSEPNVERVRRRSKIPRKEQSLGAKLVFRAFGASMADADIAEGDLVFVRPTGDLRGADGALVVCRLGSSEFLKQLQIGPHGIRLLSQNDRYLPIDVSDSDDFALIGIVVGQARQWR